MGTVMFFQLLRSSPADTLGVNLPKALEKGWRVMIRGTDPASLDRLEGDLWLVGGDDSFLPHGREGGAQDADQPVLIGQGAATNGAKVLALLDGAAADDAEIAAMERVWILFDGTQDARLQAARLQWKAITAAGHVAQYWSEDSGRWVKKAESGVVQGQAPAS